MQPVKATATVSQMAQTLTEKARRMLLAHILGWVFNHGPESKRKAKEWCELSSSALKRVRVQKKSAKKIMA